MGASEQDEARNATEQARNEKQTEPPKKDVWWFNQPLPIDRFTGWLMIYTLVLAVATIVSAGVLIKTDLTLHDTMVNGQRAYVSLNITTPIIVDDSKITFMIDNFGQTPAKDVRIWGNWEFVPFGQDLPANFQFLVRPPCGSGEGPPGQKIEPGPATVYPKSPIPAYHFHCPDVAFDLKLAESKKENAFLYGFITYLDIFNERRRTNFCFLYYPAIKTALLCNRHNEIDPEQHYQ